VPSAASLAKSFRSCRTLAPLAVEAGSFGQICIRSRSIGFFAAYREAVADIDRSRRIAADTQSVWEVLADFGSISPWADNIDHSCIINQGSEPIGTTRRVQIGRNALVETITESDTTRALGAHGGLHQKWFNLYDEATRVPFVIARTGGGATASREVTAPTSHVDLLPTLLAAAGVDVDAAADSLAESFSEVHPLPGQNLMQVVDGGPADDERAVYIMTRDNMLEGDSGASAVARRLRRTSNPPGPLRIRVPAHVASNFEGLVVRVDGQLWKLVRTFDDPATWTEPGVRHLAANGLGGEAYRMSPLDDQWELYDLTTDPVEARNRWTDPDLHELRQQLRTQLKQARAEAIPERNQPWPYASRRPS
jgi:arylsulfatase A-like enzyme